MNGLVTQEPAPAVTPTAEAEAAAIATFQLAAANRRETTRRHVHRGGLLVFWIALAGLMTSGVVWLWHLLTPIAWHFLRASQQRELQNLLITALGSTLATEYGRQWLQQLNDD